MFLTDREEDNVSHQASESDGCPLTFCISQNPLHYSMASKTAVQQVRALEELIGEDPGGPEHTQQSLYILFCLTFHIL